ncbi:hypothetical protein, partial [Herbaspirillum sp. UBA812]|uniref:hypothetical protein n=1 Tax=Herbaspirillum sp. UBA812 TaxID=1946590 RepID=UPI002579F97E
LTISLKDIGYGFEGIEDRVRRRQKQAEGFSCCASSATKPAEPRGARHATGIDARTPVNGSSSSVKSGKEFTIMLRRTVKNSWS